MNEYTIKKLRPHFLAIMQEFKENPILLTNSVLLIANLIDSEEPQVPFQFMCNHLLNDAAPELVYSLLMAKFIEDDIFTLTGKWSK